MGYGDELMGSGMARGARVRGKRIAFGDGKRIIWGPWSADIYRHNPNVAPPGSEGLPDLEWIAHYKGNRLYNRPGGRGWIWNYQFRPEPGEVYFDATERAFAAKVEPGFVLIEPNAPVKALAPNKQWDQERFRLVAEELAAFGHRIMQLEHPGTRYRIPGAEMATTGTFRQALSILSRAGLFVGHEGGMHHGAAAVGVKAVVIFGGFIPPEVTGYQTHINLAAGGTACGSTSPCEHCRAALDAITVEQVVDSAIRLLK